MNARSVAFQNRVSWRSRSQWLLKAAFGPIRLVLRLLKGRLGVMAIRCIVTFPLKVWPSMLSASSLRVLEWTGGSAAPRNSVQATPGLLNKSIAEASSQTKQLAWLTARLEALPIKRKVQLCGLAWSQAIRTLERAFINRWQNT